jgi:hypothetical protein
MRAKVKGCGKANSFTGREQENSGKPAGPDFTALAPAAVKR